MGVSNIAFENVKLEMERNNIAIKDMAKAAGITSGKMRNKLSRKTPINLNEAFLIVAKCFPDSNVWELFQELSGERNTETQHDRKMAIR